MPKTQIITFVGAGLSTVLLFILMTRVPDAGVLLLLELMIFFGLSELGEGRASIFALSLAVVLFLLSGSYSLALLGVLTGIYYFLIKALRQRRLEKTSARERYFRTLLNLSLKPLIIKDNKGRVLFSSESIKELLGLKTNLPAGTDMSQFIHPEDLVLYNYFLGQIVSSPNKKKSIEFRMKKGNSWIWVRNDSVNLLKHKDIKAVVSSVQDITTQKDTDTQRAILLEKEKNAREIAEKAVRDRDEFLSIASHELKTPLTTIVLQLQATLRKILTQSLADFSGKDLVGSLQIAEKQSQSLSTLIKDLLNVSLASSGRLTLNKEAVNLAEVVGSLSQKYEEEIKLSKSRVETHVKEPEIIGHWDPVRIEQAVNNLLMNALKYGRGEKITLTAGKDGQYAIFQIEDRGVGIAKVHLNEIFEPFRRANGNSSVKGLGVGLFITRQIARAHGGELNVLSKVGHGSIFTLRLPI